MNTIKKTTLGIFTLGFLMLGFATQKARADYYVYIINPDKTHYQIKWNGAGPNKVTAHPELGANAEVACWQIHSERTGTSESIGHIPNMGLKHDNQDVFWGELKAGALHPSGGNSPYSFKVEKGNPEIDGGANTFWVGMKGHVKRMHDCG
jgi:hypothetical protein